MQGHWIGGTRKLNRHWQSGKKGIVTRKFNFDISPRPWYPQIGLAGVVNNIFVEEIIGQSPSMLGSRDYEFLDNYINSPRVVLRIYNDDNIDIYITPPITTNNDLYSNVYTYGGPYRPVSGILRGGGSSQNVGSGANNIMTPASTISYNTVCRKITTNPSDQIYQTMGMTGYRIQPGQTLEILTFFPFFADDTHFFTSLTHRFGIDITTDQRFGDGGYLTTYKRATPLKLKIEVELYRDNTVI